MGISYRGMLCVGYTYDELNKLESFEESEDVYEFCENNGFDYFSPYYDADSNDCIYGQVVVSSEDYQYILVGRLDELISENINNLEKEFGIKPNAYLMSHSW